MTPFEQGREAARRPGSWIYNCPYCAGKQRAEYEQWMDGFRYERALQEGI